MNQQPTESAYDQMGGTRMFRTLICFLLIAFIAIAVSAVYKGCSEPVVVKAVNK